MLGWNVIGRRRGGDSDDEYTLEPGERAQDYGMEQQGNIARDYSYLQNGRPVVGRVKTLADYAAILPPRR